MMKLTTTYEVKQLLFLQKPYFFTTNLSRSEWSAS
ncbi:hypothetical protein SAMN05421740_101431 [Parapedobacter koreensis]|uniref:Uncharacterized protein n=1 Tax=Parapedobacter koreensis TaxID=332977 RepID=A0A1H7FQM4_9SPHI|nr:hypothetical protein SAMN05421740_101431 [Parapedobacter koreensis]